MLASLWVASNSMHMDFSVPTLCLDGQAVGAEDPGQLQTASAIKASASWTWMVWRAAGRWRRLDQRLRSSFKRRTISSCS
jgi:hypothetical protein